MTLRPSVVRRARSGRTVRQMTTSVHVPELHTNALGDKAEVKSIPVQTVGGSGEISQNSTLLDLNLHTSRFTGARRAMFGRSARARATSSGSETLHVPTMGSKQPRTALVLCTGAYLRPSLFKKSPLRLLY